MSEPTYAWTAGGHRIHVDLADARSHDLVAADGNLNPLSLVLWQQTLSAHPWDVVVDVGVNYGEMLIGVRLPPAARVVGFEPNPVVRALVARSFADNGLVVDLRADAVSERPGTARFAVDTDWSGTSSLDTAGAGDHHDLLEVSVTTLDQVLEDDTGSFCVKVDVEGFEREVVAGARRCLARAVPWALMLEALHMPAGLLSSLAAEHVVLLMERESHALVRVGPDEIDDVIASVRVYPQDCLVVSVEALDHLVAPGSA